MRMDDGALTSGVENLESEQQQSPEMIVKKSHDIVQASNIFDQNVTEGTIED